MKVTKKPVIVEAEQWFQNGDHTEDKCETLYRYNGDPFKSEGHVVRHYNLPNAPDNFNCSYCDRAMNDHGWIDTLEGGHVVCIGDWIIKGVKGEFYPIKDEIFRETYAVVDVSK